jgi:hypothetical protein
VSSRIITPDRKDYERVGISFPEEKVLIVPKDPGLIAEGGKVIVPRGAGQLLGAGSTELMTSIDRPLAELLQELSADNAVAAQLIGAIEQGLKNRS